MKKQTFLTLIALIAVCVFIFALVSCGDSKNTSADPVTTQTPETTMNPLMVTAYDKPEEYVTLPEFSEIVASNEKVQAEVDKYLQNVLSSISRNDFHETAEGTAAIKGDSVNIHYTGRAQDPNKVLSEETLKGMTNASSKGGYDLILGSGSFIPGFEEQLIGTKAGDTVTVDVTFPENYSEELSGVAVYFDVTVNKVSRAEVSEQNVLALSVLYSLKEGEATADLDAFMAAHSFDIDLSDDKNDLFDEYFALSDVLPALLGTNLFGTATVDLTLSAENAAKFGYETEIVLTAMITVEEIVIYPTELADEDINSYTGGAYTTVAAFTEYVTDHYKNSFAYDAIIAAAKYGEMNKEVYDYLYKGYYDSSIYNAIGDTSDMTEEELAAALTDAVVSAAEKFAEENATAEYNDRMLVGYLAKKLNFTLTEERYKELLNDFFNYYYLQFYYSGITSTELLEAYYGVETLRFQFTIDEVVSQLGKLVSWGNTEEAPETEQE